MVWERCVGELSPVAVSRAVAAVPCGPHSRVPDPFPAFVPVPAICRFRSLPLGPSLMTEYGMLDGRNGCPPGRPHSLLRVVRVSFFDGFCERVRDGWWVMDGRDGT